MSLPTTQNLTAVRGDDWSHQATFTLVTGSLVGSKIWFTIKTRESDADSAALLQLNTVTGGVVIDDATHATVTLTAAQTELLTPGTKFYDMAVLTSGGKNYTAVKGRFIVVSDVTQTRV
jgi:hypothetical protein